MAPSSDGRVLHIILGDYDPEHMSYIIWMYLGLQSVAYHFGVTVTMTSDLVFVSPAKHGRM